MSVLKFSNKFSMFALVTPPVADFCIRAEASQIVLLPFDDPLEYLRQSFMILENGS